MACSGWQAAESGVSGAFFQHMLPVASCIGKLASRLTEVYMHSNRCHCVTAVTAPHSWVPLYRYVAVLTAGSLCDEEMQTG